MSYCLAYVWLRLRAPHLGKRKSTPTRNLASLVIEKLDHLKP
jgi:hypothetical protein